MARNAGAVSLGRGRPVSVETIVVPAPSAR